eukprot:scaffold324_cov326-Pavlova_lutheri.AAC.2
MPLPRFTTSFSTLSKRTWRSASVARCGVGFAVRVWRRTDPPPRPRLPPRSNPNRHPVQSRTPPLGNPGRLRLGTGIEGGGRTNKEFLLDRRGGGRGSTSNRMTVFDPFTNSNSVNSDTPFALAYVNDPDSPRSSRVRRLPLLSVLPTQIRHHATSALHNHTNSITEHQPLQYPPRRLSNHRDRLGGARHGLLSTRRGHVGPRLCRLDTLMTSHPCRDRGSSTTSHTRT